MPVTVRASVEGRSPIILAREKKKNSTGWSLILKGDGRIEVIDSLKENNDWEDHIPCESKLCPHKHILALRKKAKDVKTFKIDLEDVQLSNEFNSKKLWLFKYKDGLNLHCSAAHKQELCTKLRISSTSGTTREQFCKSIKFTPADNPPDRDSSSHAAEITIDSQHTDVRAASGTEDEQSNSNAARRMEDALNDGKSTSKRHNSDGKSTSKRHNSYRTSRHSTARHESQKRRVIVGKMSSDTGSYKLVQDGMELRIEKIDDFNESELGDVGEKFHPAEHKRTLLKIAQQGDNYFKERVRAFRLAKHDYDDEFDCYCFYVEKRQEPLRCDFDTATGLMDKFKLDGTRELQKFLERNESPKAPRQESRTAKTKAQGHDTTSSRSTLRRKSSQGSTSAKIFSSQKLDKLPRKESQKKCVVFDPAKNKYMLLTWGETVTAYPHLENSALPPRSLFGRDDRRIVKEIKQEFKMSQKSKISHKSKMSQESKTSQESPCHVIATLFYACPPLGRYIVVYKMTSAIAQKVGLKDSVQQCTKSAYLWLGGNKKEIEDKLTKEARIARDDFASQP